MVEWLRSDEEEICLERLRITTKDSITIPGVFTVIRTEYLSNKVEL
jgi:hypothetical protein